MTATITPDKDAPDWFWVQSRSGHEPHLVDVAYQEEPWCKPKVTCSCWRHLCYGETCWHIQQLAIMLHNASQCPANAPKSDFDAPNAQ